MLSCGVLAALMLAKQPRLKLLDCSWYMPAANRYEALLAAQTLEQIDLMPIAIGPFI